MEKTKTKRMQKPALKVSDLQQQQIALQQQLQRQQQQQPQAPQPQQQQQQQQQSPIARPPNPGTPQRGLPNEHNVRLQLQQLQREREMLLKRQEEIARQELMMQAVIGTPNTPNSQEMLLQDMNTSQSSQISVAGDMQTVTSGVDPFLGQAGTNSSESHARQNSADSGLGGMGTNYSLPRTPEDFLGNVDEGMDSSESGHSRISSQPNQDLNMDMTGNASMEVSSNMGEANEGPTGMDSDDLVPSLHEDISNELLNDVDVQKMESLLTWL
jgi:hypothetical protein